MPGVYMMYSSDTQRVAIVGAGVIARSHILAVKHLRDCRIVALCDKDERRAAAVASEWGIDRHYSEFSGMLDAEKPSVVAILTPPQSHAELAVESLKRGVNVLVEKPFTASLTDADRVLSASRDSKAKLTVVYHWLFSRVIRRALDLYESGVLGEILRVDLALLHRKDDPMASDSSHWCHRLPGGRFGEMLPHPIYLLQAFLGDDLRLEGVPLADKRGTFTWLLHDELQVSLRGAKGSGHVYVSFNAPRPVILVNVYGSQKILRIDILNQTLLDFGPSKLDKKDLALSSLGLSTRLAYSTLANVFAFAGRESGAYSIENIYRDFVRCIRHNTQPRVTPQMACNTVRIVEQICNYL
jgi:predicted dehydrogenase